MKKGKKVKNYVRGQTCEFLIWDLPVENLLDPFKSFLLALDMLNHVDPTLHCTVNL